jgi:disulfide bond formation protein DsbB
MNNKENKYLANTDSGFTNINNESKMVKKNKGYIERFWIGVKKGWDTDTLPPHLLKLQLHPLIRIFRVIGGISVLSILTKQIEKLNIYALYVAVFISVIYGIYVFYITYKRIKHMFYILKNKKLEIRNSPLDKLGTLAAKLIFCAKGACDQAAPVGIVLGVLAGIDLMIEGSGRDAIFLPFLGKAILPATEETKINNEIKWDYKQLKEAGKKYGQILQDKEAVNALEKTGIFNKEDLEFMREGIHKHEKVILENKDALVQKIREGYEKLSKK